MILEFMYSRDEIAKRVKEETSIFANHQLTRTETGQQFDFIPDFILDEEHRLLFDRYFDEAHAELMTYFPSIMLKDTPTDFNPIHKAFIDYYPEDREFALYLNVSDDFPEQYRKSLDIKMREFFIDYICYRWFEKIAPQAATTYFVRLENLSKGIIKLLNKRNTPLRRLPNFL